MNISDNQLYIQVKANVNIRNLSFDALFLSETKNVQYEVNKNIDIDKNQTKNVVFNLNKIKKELNGSEPTSVKISNLNYYVNNTYIPEIDTKIAVYCTMITILLIIAISVAWAADRKANEKAEKSKEENFSSEEPEKSIFEKWKQKRDQLRKEIEERREREAEEKYQRETERLRKQQEQREEFKRQQRAEEEKRNYERQKQQEAKYMNHCKICGQPSGIYQICRECQKDIAEGKVSMCPYCGNYYITSVGCSCSGKKEKQEPEEDEKSPFKDGVSKGAGAGCGCLLVVGIVIAIILIVIMSEVNEFNDSISKIFGM